MNYIRLARNTGASIGLANALLTGCNYETKENTSGTYAAQSLSNLPVVQKEFLAKAGPEAASIEKIARESGASMPADAILAHAALESDWGTSLRARANNNYFGITCSTPSPTCSKGETHNFRHYESMAASFDDYRKLIMSNHKYRFVAVANNAQDYFEAVGKSNYAEESDMTMRLANRYNAAPFAAVAQAYRDPSYRTSKAPLTATVKTPTKTEYVRARPQIAPVTAQVRHETAEEIQPQPAPLEPSRYNPTEAQSKVRKTGLSFVLAEIEAGWRLR